MRRGGRAAAPRLARCERAAASRWILYSFYCPKGLSRNKVANLRDVTQVNLSKIIHVILGQTLTMFENAKLVILLHQRSFAFSTQPQFNE